jgi:integrase
MRRRGLSTRHADDTHRVLSAAMAAGVDDLKADDAPDRISHWLDTVPGRHGAAPTPRTVNRYRAVLRAACRYAMKRWPGLLPYDPTVAVPPMRDRRRGRLRESFSVEELAELVSDTHATDPMFLPVALAIYAGLRRGEIMHAEWSWIRWQDAEIHVRQTESGWTPKRDKERRLPLQPELAELLKPTAGVVGPLFPDLATSKPACFSQRVGSYIRRCGIDSKERGLHSLRHSWVSLCCAVGANALAVQQWAGHSSITTTAGYAHAIPARSVEGWGNGCDFFLRDRTTLCEHKTHTETPDRKPLTIV